MMNTIPSAHENSNVSLTIRIHDMIQSELDTFGTSLLTRLLKTIQDTMYNVPTALQSALQIDIEDTVHTLHQLPIQVDQIVSKIQDQWISAKEKADEAKKAMDQLQQELVVKDQYLTIANTSVDELTVRNKRLQAEIRLHEVYKLVYQSNLDKSHVSSQEREAINRQLQTQVESQQQEIEQLNECNNRLLTRMTNDKNVYDEQLCIMTKTCEEFEQQVQELRAHRKPMTCIHPISRSTLASRKVSLITSIPPSVHPCTSSTPKPIHSAQMATRASVAAQRVKVVKSKSESTRPRWI